MTATSDIPTIDVAQLSDAGGRSKLHQACAEWGLFTLVNHGIELPTTDNLLSQAAHFFHQSATQKGQIRRTPDNPWGYYESELTKNTPDWKEIFDYGPAHGQMVPQWPTQPADFKRAIQDFYAACEGLAFTLLDAMALTLDTPASVLRNAFLPSHSSFTRVNYYPLCTNPESPTGVSTPATGFLGVNHHTDSGLLTILLQDSQPGLDVLKDNHWYQVPTVPGALTINLGDIAQVWSNDRYIAPLHRVRANSQAERFSAPFFFNPGYHADYAPLASQVSSNSPARYRSINWGDFRRLRADGDYANYGQEVQISDYAINEGSRNDNH